MTPDVVLEWRDIQIADEQGAFAASGSARGATTREFVEEGELVRKLFVDFGIRLVAAGGHVKIMDRQRLRKMRLAVE